MPAVAYIVFGALFTAVVSFALGRVALRRLGCGIDAAAESFLAFVLGSALLSLAVFTAAALGIVHKGVFIAFGLVVLFAARKLLRPSLPAAPLWFWAGYVFFLGFYFVYALAPETSPDGTTYHLGLVSRYYRQHGFAPIPTTHYASLSQGVEMLFLFAFSVGRHSAAALTHWMFLAAAPLGLATLGRSGAAAGLLFLCTPVIGIDGTTAYNDVAVACVLIALFIAIERAAPPLAIGAIAGFAFAAKYTAFLAVPYALYRMRRRWLHVSAGVMLIAAPWLVKNAIATGNPVAPFFNRVFRNPYFHIQTEEAYRAYLRNYGELTSFTELPLELTIKGQRLGGLLGPLFLLTPLALLALRKPLGRRAFAAALFFALPYPANTGTRFLIPALPFLALSLATAFEGPLLIPLVCVHAVLSWPGVLKTYADPGAYRLRRFPLDAAFRVEPEDRFLARTLAAYPLTRLLEQLVPPGKPVFTQSAIAEAYTSRETIVPYESSGGEELRDILWTPLRLETQPIFHKRFYFEPRRVRRLRIVQATAAGPLDNFSIGELRAFHNGVEIPRTAAWRINAFPNARDAANAIDGNRATRWKSFEAIKPGMFVEVDFGGEETINSVTVEAAPEQYAVRMRLEADGIAISKQTEDAEVPSPPDIRRQAALAMRSRGVEYLVAYDTDFGSKDYAELAVDWGFELLGKRGAVALYYIKP